MERTAQLKRDTNETQIEVVLSLDGSGKGEIDTGVGFLTICSRDLPVMDCLT